eukprot:m.32096 g.32096  ORF g.32096 m.32096 type:complete len:343 (+) comp12123_c0_seq2:92-1120(+)
MATFMSLLCKRQSKRGYYTRYGADTRASDDDYSSQDDGTVSSSYTTAKRKKLTKEQQQELLQTRIKAAKQREARLANRSTTKRKAPSSSIRTLSKGAQEETGVVSKTSVSFSDTRAERGYYNPTTTPKTTTTVAQIRRLQHLTSVPITATHLSKPVLASTTNVDAKGRSKVTIVTPTSVTGYAIQPPAPSTGHALSTRAVLQMMMGLEPPLSTIPKPRLVQAAIHQPRESVIVTSPSQKEALAPVSVAAQPNQGGLGGQGIGNGDAPMLALVPTTIIGAEDDQELGNAGNGMETVPDMAVPQPVVGEPVQEAKMNDGKPETVPGTETGPVPENSEKVAEQTA